MTAHALAIEQVFARARTTVGTHRQLMGHRGRCLCGATSDLYGIEAPIQEWFRWHLDPTGQRARGRRRF